MKLTQNSDSTPIWSTFSSGFNRFNLWTGMVIAIALLVALPILFVLSGLLTPASDTWAHLAATVLPQYLLNSLWLMIGVGIGVAVLGVGTAWLVTLCRFPGARIFEWALLLPLAAPAYVLAYTYTEILEYYGWVQSTLRLWFGWSSPEDYWFPNIRSLGGAILMLILVLYPYVYLLARSTFLSQSTCMLEASRSLGCNPWRSFWTIALPLSRPAIMAGLSLALMETLNDYGTVEFFAVPTFTTGIYRTWFGMGQQAVAVQLAACLLVFILGLILLERWSRGQSRYYQTTSQQQRLLGYPLKGIPMIGAILACFLPVGLGFLLPAGFLLNLARENASQTFDERFWTISGNSFLLSSLTAAVAVLLALIMAYGLRLQPNWTMRGAVQIAASGYAVPGSVIAVGVLVPIGRLDNTIDAWMKSNFGLSTGLLLSGTISALIFAYLIRFLAVSFSTVDASLTRIKPSLDDAARNLGQTATGTLLRVHTPLLRGGLLTATILVFVDVMKELPATLIIRPFNFETLAVRVYQLASDERLAEAAGPALAIVGVGLLPVMLLSWQLSRSRRSLQEEL